MATIFNFGNSNWAVKEDYALAYNNENNNFKSLPIDFTRASTATQVNKNGLIEVVNKGVPRIDFSNNTKGHFLSEPSRTNLVTHSEDFSDSSWFKNANTSVSVNTATSPTGENNATTLTISTAFPALYDTITTTASTDYVFTFYVKNKNISDITYRVYDASNAADIISPTSYYSQIGNDWTRISISFTTPSGCLSTRVYLCSDNSGVGEVYIWGAQVEQGGYATTIIKTVGATVTRVADDSDCITGRFIEMNDVASVYFDVLGHPQGSGINSANKAISAMFYSADVNKSYVSLNTNGTNWRVRVQDFTSSNFQDTGVSQTENIKCVVVMNTSGYSIYVNGSTVVSNESYNGTSPTGFIDQLKQIDIYNGSNDRGVYKIRDMRVFDSELTEAEAQELTS